MATDSDDVGHDTPRVKPARVNNVQAQIDLKQELGYFDVCSGCSANTKRFVL